MIRRTIKEVFSRRDALEVAKAVLEHRLGENTLASTNVKGKL